MQLTKKIKSDLLEIRTTLEEIAYSTYSEGYDCIDCDTLCGACALSAVLTWRYFKTKGLNPLFLYHERHCLIQVDNKFIDLTATQYDYSELFIDDIEHLENYYGKQFKKYKHPGLLAFRFYNAWKEQNPYWLLKKFYD